MRRAARIDANQTEIVDALRAAGYVVHIIGQPVDLLVGTGSAWCLMEIKDGSKPPSARKLTPTEADCVRQGGGPIAVVTDTEGALRAMSAIGPEEDLRQAALRVIRAVSSDSDGSVTASCDEINAAMDGLRFAIEGRRYANP